MDLDRPSNFAIDRGSDLHPLVRSQVIEAQLILQANDLCLSGYRQSLAGEISREDANGLVGQVYCSQNAADYRSVHPDRIDVLRVIQPEVHDIPSRKVAQANRPLRRHYLNIPLVQVESLFLFDADFTHKNGDNARLVVEFVKDAGDNTLALSP
jgi:hypothetical protein